MARLQNQSASVRTGPNRARRQPGNASKSLRKTTTAGATGNIGGGVGPVREPSAPTDNMISGSGGGPNSPADVGKPQ